jgi:hypothetical protein
MQALRCRHSALHALCEMGGRRRGAGTNRACEHAPTEPASMRRQSLRACADRACEHAPREPASMRRRACEHAPIEQRPTRLHGPFIRWSSLGEQLLHSAWASSCCIQPGRAALHCYGLPGEKRPSGLRPGEKRPSCLRPGEKRPSCLRRPFFRWSRRRAVLRLPPPLRLHPCGPQAAPCGPQAAPSLRLHSRSGCTPASETL